MTFEQVLCVDAPETDQQSAEATCAGLSSAVFTHQNDVSMRHVTNPSALVCSQHYRQTSEIVGDGVGKR